MKHGSNTETNPCSIRVSSVAKIVLDVLIFRFTRPVPHGRQARPREGPCRAVGVRLDSGQAEAYDDFRRRLLQGREAMYRAVPVPEGGVWVDLGGGTGANLEPIGGDLHKARKVYLVDLCDLLLAVARKRCEARGLEERLRPSHADATTFRPADGPADVVTFSYSLTMIPDWFAAIDNARAMLRPGGTIGVADFFVARKYPAEGRARHAWFTRTFWPAWFGWTTSSFRPTTFPICSETSRRCNWKRSGRRCLTFR